MTDRTYFRIRAWHGLADYEHVDPDRITVYLRSLCRRLVPLESAETADRLPPSAHLCGNCARIIAARTDVESDAADSGSDYGTFVAPV